MSASSSNISWVVPLFYLFAIVEVKDWFFKFTVFSREVGLLVYKLGSVSTDMFKVAFHLWNERGLHFAQRFVSASQGPIYDWVQVGTKKNS